MLNITQSSECVYYVHETGGYHEVRLVIRYHRITKIEGRYDDEYIARVKDLLKDKGLIK